MRPTFAVLVVFLLTALDLPTANGSLHDGGKAGDEPDPAGDAKGSPEENVTRADGRGDAPSSSNASAPEQPSSEGAGDGGNSSARPPPGLDPPVAADEGTGCPGPSGGPCPPLLPWTAAPVDVGPPGRPGFAVARERGCPYPTHRHAHTDRGEYLSFTGRHVGFCLTPDREVFLLATYWVEGTRVLDHLSARAFHGTHRVQGSAALVEGEMLIPGPHQEDAAFRLEANDAPPGTLTVTCRPSEQFEAHHEIPFYDRYTSREYCTLKLAPGFFELASIDGIGTLDSRRPGEPFWAAVEASAPSHPLSFFTRLGPIPLAVHLGLPCTADRGPCEDATRVHANLAFFAADGLPVPGSWARPGWRTLEFLGQVEQGSDRVPRVFVWAPADDWVLFAPNWGGTGHWLMFRGMIRVVLAQGSLSAIAPVPEEVRHHIHAALGGGGSAWSVDLPAGAEGLEAVPSVFGAPAAGTADPQFSARPTERGFVLSVEAAPEAPPSTLLLNVPWTVLPQAARSAEALDLQWRHAPSAALDAARLRRVPLHELAQAGEGGRYAAVVGEDALHLLIQPSTGGPAELVITAAAGGEPTGIPFPQEGVLVVVGAALLVRHWRVSMGPPGHRQRSRAPR